MKITQVFRSSKDERVISEIEIGGADQATPEWSNNSDDCEGGGCAPRTRSPRMEPL
jgi:hypothetical protein